MTETFLAVPSVQKRHGEQAALIHTGQFVSGVRRALPRRGTRDLLQAYSNSPVLQAVVRKISTSMAAVRWVAKVRTPEGAEIPAPNHIAERLINGGVPGLDGVQCRIFEQQCIELVGEAFGVLDRNTMGVPNVRWPVPPHWVANVPQPTEGFFSVQPPGGAPLTIRREDMIWHKDVDPHDPYRRGVGIARALVDELNADEAAAKHVASSLTNRARPDIIISGSKEVPLEKEDAVRLNEMWLQRFGGPENAGKPFVSASPINVDVLTPSFRELQLSKMREFERDIIITVFGVPPEIMGVIINSNRALIEGAELFYNKYVLTPRLKARRSTYNEQLAVQYDERLLIDFEDPVDENREFKLQVTSSRPAAFTDDEVRETAGLPPLPDGEGEMRPKVDPPRNGEDALKTSPDPALASPHPEHKGRVTKIIEDDIGEILAAIDNDLMVILVRTQTTSSVAEFGSDALGDIGVNIDFDIDSPAVTQFISDNAASQSQLINGTTQKNLRITLSEGVAQGDAQASLIARVQSVVTDANAVRADMIARTETTRAAGFANEQALEQAGLTEKEWLAVQDDRTRDTHAEMDGQTQPVGQPFLSPSGDTAMYPGDFSTAAENANCRCVVVSAESLTDKSMRVAAWQAKASQMERIADIYARQLRSVFREQGKQVVEALEGLG